MAKRNKNNRLIHSEPNQRRRFHSPLQFWHKQARPLSVGVFVIDSIKICCVNPFFDLAMNNPEVFEAIVKKVK